MTDSEKYAAMLEDLRIAVASDGSTRVKRAWDRLHTFLIEQGDIEAPDPDAPDCVVEGDDEYWRVDR